MDKKEAKNRIKKLKKTINYHRHLYHVKDSHEISDSALDSLKKELFDLEQKFPEFITQDSPTQRVGGKPADKFKKVKHFLPMISLNDAFLESDIMDWQERISKLLTNQEKSEIDFYCELKIDGLAVELVFENNILKIGSTRGDGQIGEDITQNLKTIEAIPLKIRGKEEIIADLKKENISLEIISNIEKYGFSKQIIARGEVFISKKEFEKINKEQKKNNLPEYANPRNLAAGSIRQLDSSITALRRLDSFAYDLITDFGAKTHEQRHLILKALGFKINNFNKYCKNIEEVFKFHKHCQKIREKLDYEIDGIVVLVNSNYIFKKLGIVGKAPRAAIAFKFPSKQATTIVKDIKIYVGRTGALTPVAVLEPVQVGGTTISRATLHNENEIEKLGVKINDTVIVGRAGDVIPDITKVLKEMRTGKEKSFKMPDSCPVCKTKTIKKQGETIARCPNPDCFAKKREYFYYFVSKKAFDMQGLGNKIIDNMADNGLVLDPADLFFIKKEDLLSLERFAEKSASNIINSIDKKKEIIFLKFIYALGIRNVGEETARDLADFFGNIKNLKNVSIEDLERIKDIGPVTAKSVYEWFQKKENIEFLKKLEKAGVKIKKYASEKKAANKKLQGIKFVITGELKTITREKAREKIISAGGDFSDSVSSKTDFVVVGENPGSKLEKAEKLGLKIIKEKEFLELIG